MRPLAIVAVLWLASCVTPYQPRGLLGGYDSEPLGRGQWFVEVRGNGFTSETTLLRYFHRRAAELCGADYEATWQTETDRVATTEAVASGGRTRARASARTATTARHVVAGVVRCSTQPEVPQATTVDLPAGPG